MKNNKIIKNIVRYIILISLMFLAAINYNLFLSPNKIISGGTNGLSIICQELFGLEPAIFILIFNVIVLIFSFIILGIEVTSSSIVATLIYPLFVSLTSGISSITYFQADDTLLVGIYSGMILGFNLGVIWRIGFSQGGISQISQIINKIFKIPTAKINFVLNGIILICGVFVFGISSALLGVIVIAISSYVGNKILLGISSNKSFLIITNKEDEVADFVRKELGHGVTIFYINDNKKKKKALMTVVPTREYYKVTNGIKKIDKDAFFVVTDSYQLEGGI